MDCLTSRSVISENAGVTSVIHIATSGTALVIHRMSALPIGYGIVDEWLMWMQAPLLRHVGMIPDNIPLFACYILGCPG